MRFLCLFGVLFGILVSQLHGQTRKIGHRSHSGSSETFAMLLGEDHLGDSPEMWAPRYNVEPFVQKIRLHYEKVAAQNPALRTTLPNDPLKTNNVPSADTAVANPSSIPTQGSKAAPAKNKSPKTPAPIAVEIPSPSFLVQSQMREAALNLPTEQKESAQQHWSLWLLLACTVAPGMFVATAIATKRRL